MGKAKRRRELAAWCEEIPFVDFMTGETGLARRAGDITEWRARFGRIMERIRAGDKAAAAPVPRKTCTACCYIKVVEIDPAVDDLTHLDTVPATDGEGGLMLRKRPDGACVHLGPSGCTVYNHRSTVCGGSTAGCTP